MTLFQTPIVRVLTLALFALFAGESYAQSIEKQTLTHVANLRTIRADADDKTVEGYNKSMDEAWKFFDNNKAAVIPVLRRELAAEVRKAKPSDLVLLDIGFYLSLQGETSDKELVKTALFTLNPAADIVYVNQQQLFKFAFTVARDQDERFLPFVEKAFLRQKMFAYVPQHSLTLGETMVCVLLYGVHGTSSEAHLKKLLKDKALTHKVLEILIWIGTPDSVPEVREVMLADRTRETFGRGTTFMMQAGGPQGRAFMLGINPKDFDAQTQEYFQRVRPMIEATSYETLRKMFSAGGDFQPLNDEVVKKRLADMFENDGKDDSTDPRAILDSSLPRAFLTSELVRIRARMFRRLSDEALSDVRATNAILNALYYREK